MKEVEITGWTIFFFNVSAIGFIISLFLFFKKNNSRVPYILLGVYTLINSYQIFEYDLFWTHLIFKLPHFSNIATALEFLIAPLLFLFFRSIFNFTQLSKKDLFHFVPFLAALIFKLPYLASSALEKYNYHFDNKITYWFFNLAFPWAAILQAIVYAILISKIIKSQSRIANTKTLSNLLLYLFILLIFSKALYYIFVHFSWFNPLWDYNISVLISCSILISGWLGIISQSIFNGYSIGEAAMSKDSYTKSFDFKYSFLDSIKTTPLIKTVSTDYKVSINQVIPQQKTNGESLTIAETKEEKPKPDFVKYKNSSLTESAADELKVLLDNYMREVKLYRENDITLDGLASKLNTSRHNLSQVINEKYKLNFFDYINLLRIKEAQEILLDKKNQKLQIIDIAFQVGYNNKATFNNAFKKFSGTTPSEYRAKAS